MSSDLQWTPRGLKFIAVVQAFVATGGFIALIAVATALIVGWWM